MLCLRSRSIRNCLTRMKPLHSNINCLTSFSNVSLPRLSIPILSETASFLKQNIMVDADSNLQEKIVDEFTSSEGLGESLQSRLLENMKKDNLWLENLWTEKHLKNRNSLLHSNWFFEFKDHPKQPKDLLIRPPPKGVLSKFQVERTAGLISNILNFKELHNRGVIPDDFENNTPLCMNQYLNLFGISRNPGEKIDSVAISNALSSDYIIVSLQNQIYKVKVFLDHGIRLSLSDLERILYAIGRNCLETEPEPSIGALTSANRRQWFKAQAKISKLSPQNEQNLKDISEALFFVCLDDSAQRGNHNISHLQFSHNFDASNRWFDKNLQLIVASSGRAGANTE
ncbi:Carnitine O-acetyltransferase mitochondrial, partial [Nowakowskiella sp. JEL0078]